MPEVSVIIPCYNLAKYLSASVESVIAQTVTDWECIVINDGSTDETKAVATSLANADERIRYFEQPNSGPSAARNLGLAFSKGQYIQFLDADDWIEPGKFEQQLAVLKSAPGLSLSYCDYQRYCDPRETRWKTYRIDPDLDLREPLRDLTSRWEDGLSIALHCFLFDARLFSAHNIRFDDRLRNHEDWDCWMKIFRAKPLVFYVHQMLATYRFRPDSVGTNFTDMRKDFVAAIRKQMSVFAGDAEMQNLLREKLRQVNNEYRDYRFPRSAYLRVHRKIADIARRRENSYGAC